MERGDRLGGGQPHHDPADEARPGRGGDCVEVAEADARGIKGAGDQAVEMLDMGARRDLGHHPAVGPVIVGLGAHQIGQHGVVAAHYRGRGIVAAGLDAEDHGGPPPAVVGPGGALGPARLGAAVRLGAFDALLAERAARAPGRIARLRRLGSSHHLEFRRL